MLPPLTLVIALLSTLACTTLDDSSGSNGTYQPRPVPYVVPLQLLAYEDAASGVRGTPFALQLPAAGGVPPYRFTLVSGVLPDGITLQPNGQVVGTATVEGTFEFSIEIEDFESTTAVADFYHDFIASGSPQPFVMLPVRDITFGEGQSFGYQPFVQGGDYPWTFEVSGLPAGADFDVDTGLLSGQVDVAVEFSMSMSVTDSTGVEASGSPAQIPVDVVPPSIPDEYQGSGGTGGTDPPGCSCADGLPCTGHEECEMRLGPLEVCGCPVN